MGLTRFEVVAVFGTGAVEFAQFDAITVTSNMDALVNRRTGCRVLAFVLYAAEPFVQTLAGPFNIEVSAICLAHFNTPMFSAMLV